MKYFSAFTGAGGFEQAVPDHWECVGFSEIDKAANSILAKRFPNVRNYGDINEINPSEIPDFDTLIGGSPCQSFSSGSRYRNGLDGKSGLFFGFLQILTAKTPKYFVWENVEGCLSTNKGSDFARIQILFSEAGYNVQWQVINARWFGIPQNRERISVVGSYRGIPLPKVLYKKPEVDRKNYVGCLTANSYKKQSNANYILEKDQIARLTPLEFERLMGWQDNWTEGLDDHSRVTLCANGVVPQMFKEIFTKLI